MVGSPSSIAPGRVGLPAVVALPPQYVVRAGLASVVQLRAGTRHTINGHGFSIQTAPHVTVDELARGGQFPNRQISVTTVRRLLDVGVAVRFPTPGAGAYHGTAIVPDPVPSGLFEALNQAFTPHPNPFPVPPNRPRISR